MRPGQGALRLGRVAAFALSAVGVGSAAHVAGGGEVPVAGMLLALPLVMIAVNPLAARRRGLLTLGAAMAGVQALLHVVFLAADTHGGVCQAADAHGHAVTCSSMTSMQPTPTMLAAHVLAAAALVALLARGEQAVWALAEWVSFRVRRWVAGLPTPLPTGSSPSPVMLFDGLKVLRHRPAEAQRRRGPPRTART